MEIGIGLPSTVPRVTGDELAGMIAGSAAKDADTVKQYIAAFEQAGADEFVLFPCSSNPEQVDFLAEAAGL